MLIFYFALFLCVNRNYGYNFWDIDVGRDASDLWELFLEGECQNDAYLNGTECLCNSYTQGVNCQTWDCVNFGGGSSGNRESCECPTLLAGPHCEPGIFGLLDIRFLVACVGDNIAYDDLFKSPQTALTLFITYTEKYQKGSVMSKPDNFTTGIINALANVPTINRMNLFFLGNQLSIISPCKRDLF